MLAGLLAKEAGIDVNKVNYIPHSGGGESIASLLGNHVAAGINGYAELNSFIQTGKMRALAISSEQRLPGLDIPTFVEQGIDLSLANWRGVAAAPGISSQQRAALIALIDRMRRSDEWKAVLKRNSWIDMYLPGPEFDAFLAQENVRVTGVLKSIGLIE
ncbi:MAG: tripartite tricarboxylate transporter substrate-binding protein, partial [Acidobacteria bacterium]|nr:tripartite tricarboxylate transporter substrate-binding protein [Acidobacteriota bacterium]